MNMSIKKINVGYEDRELVESARVEGEGESEGERAEMAEVEDKRKEKRGDSGWAPWPFGRSTNFRNLPASFIRKLPFVRWVKEITQEQWGNLRFQVLALLTLQDVQRRMSLTFLRMPFVCNPCQMCQPHAKGCSVGT